MKRDRERDPETLALLIVAATLLTVVTVGLGHGWLLLLTVPVTFWVWGAVLAILSAILTRPVRAILEWKRGRRARRARKRGGAFVSD